MKILIACEYSATVREAFHTRGHDAWSCDLLPTDVPGQHYQCDVRDVLANDWDLVIAHPPCQHIAVSGARYFKQKQADGRQQQGIDFFMLFTRLSCRWCIENPVGIMSRVYRKPDQIIQPHEFGHPESKKTCLWLNGLPKLTPTSICQPPRYSVGENGRQLPRWDNQTASGQNSLSPSQDRSQIRSKTYQGIAEAMAEQWGGICK